MFGTPGIDVDDLPWIERDQFVYFMEMEHHLNDPGDWPRFREGLVAALATAFGWDPSHALDDARHDDEVLVLLEAARQVADPAVNWNGFVDEVWSGTRAIGKAAPSGR